MGEYYRSKSYGDGRMEIETYNVENGNGWVKGTNYSGGNGDDFQDLRCYSASYATSATATATATTQHQQQQQQQQHQVPKELKKGKSANASTSSSKVGWCFSDPELQRKKRVASYKSYSVEGKIKRSFSKSFRWLKHRLPAMF